MVHRRTEVGGGFRGERERRKGEVRALRMLEELERALGKGFIAS